MRTQDEWKESAEDWGSRQDQEQQLNEAIRQLKLEVFKHEETILELQAQLHNQAKAAEAN